MWVVNYAAPGVAIAGLGVTYYALMRKDMHLEQQNQEYTAYVLDILEKTKETNNVREEAEILDLRHHHRHRLSLPLSACEAQEFCRSAETAPSPPPPPPRCRSLQVTRRVPKPFNTSKTSVTSGGVAERTREQNGVQFVSNAVALRGPMEEGNVRLKTLSVSHTYLKTKIESFVRDSGNIEGLNVLSSDYRLKHADEDQRGGGQELEQVVRRASLQLHTTTSSTDLFPSPASTSKDQQQETLNEVREPSINSSFQLIFSSANSSEAEKDGDDEDDNDNDKKILYVQQTASRQHPLTEDERESGQAFSDPEIDIIKPCRRHRQEKQKQQQFPPPISGCRPHEQCQSQMFRDGMVMENPSSSSLPPRGQSFSPRILNEKEEGQQCRNVLAAAVEQQECYENDNFSDISIMEAESDSISIKDHIPRQTDHHHQDHVDEKNVTGDNQKIISMMETTQQQQQLRESIHDYNLWDSDDDDDDDEDHHGSSRRHGRKTSSTITVIHNPSSSSSHHHPSPLTCCFTNPRYGPSGLTEQDQKKLQNDGETSDCSEINLTSVKRNHGHYQGEEEEQVYDQQLRQRRPICDMGQLSSGHKDNNAHFLLPPSLSPFDSVMSTCLHNPLTDLVSRSASKTQVQKSKKGNDDDEDGKKGSFDYLHLHELAVNDILNKFGLTSLYSHSDDPNVHSRQATFLRHHDDNNKKNSVLKLAQRTQSLPDLLHKDLRYGASVPSSWPHCQDTTTTQFIPCNASFMMMPGVGGWWLKCRRISIHFLKKNCTSQTIRVLFVCLLCGLILAWIWSLMMGRRRTGEPFFSSKNIGKTVVNVKSPWHW